MAGGEPAPRCRCSWGTCHSLAKPRDVSDFLAMENPILKPCALQLHGQARAPLVQSLATQTVIAAMRIQHFVRRCLAKHDRTGLCARTELPERSNAACGCTKACPKSRPRGKALNSARCWAQVPAPLCMPQSRQTAGPLRSSGGSVPTPWTWTRKSSDCEHSKYIIQAYYVIDNSWTGLVLEKLRDSLFHFAEERCISVVDLAAAQLAQALHWLQGCAVVHGDVKAANVFLQSPSCDWPRCLKLGDFESAQFAGAGLLTKKVDTVFYWLPEMLEGRGYSFGHDVWSLGKLLGDLRCETSARRH